MEKNCLFCRIANGKESNVIYYEDSDVMVFEDIRPAAEYHYLAIPIKHIPNVNDMKATHIELLKSLKKAGEKVLNAHILQKLKCITALLPSESGAKTVTVPTTPIQTIFGFHVPPYNSQHHLHMHIVAPADNLSINGRERILGTNCFRFTSYQDQLERLEKLVKSPVKRKACDGCNRCARSPKAVKLH